LHPKVDRKGIFPGTGRKPSGPKLLAPVNVPSLEGRSLCWRVQPASAPRLLAGRMSLQISNATTPGSQPGVRHQLNYQGMNWHGHYTVASKAIPPPHSLSI